MELNNDDKRPGDVKWGLIALLLGLPLPIVVLFFLCGGCNSGSP
jgi:hypothetical protein